ncbi:DNA cytosine methyltransferase [Eleftheria terrae]|uniref:DNA cytosine methyltransferase n=1 Tax=Eleftheria terrae TaxID=1597781 RepID=UPI00263B2A05|nr:DNA cytosine methyltransferase [Eleftheria terrae]WKB52981.1 DNA cytosine methyltransferase [Eleftheria terrae]
MKVLDLFCGAAGGWSLGLHRAGFTTVAACEIDPARRGAFAHNNPGVRMYDDVRTVTAARLLGDLGYLPDVICGSPPCQDASTANHKGRGIDGERTGLFRDFVRIVGEVRPRWVAAENVPGIRTRGADWVLDALAAEGYACWPLMVGAVHAGAPHLRQRVWFVAVHADQIGRDEGKPRRPQREREAQAELGHADAGHACHPDQEGLALWEGERRDPGTQLQALERAGAPALDPHEDQRGSSASDEEVARHCAALERATGPRRIRFNGGPAGHLRVAYGVPPRLARSCIAAYGDAVLPQITEAIGNAIRRTEHAMRGTP